MDWGVSGRQCGATDLNRVREDDLAERVALVLGVRALVDQAHLLEDGRPAGSAGSVRDAAHFPDSPAPSCACQPRLRRGRRTSSILISFLADQRGSVACTTPQHQLVLLELSLDPVILLLRARVGLGAACAPVSRCAGPRRDAPQPMASRGRCSWRRGRRVKRGESSQASVGELRAECRLRRRGTMDGTPSACSSECSGGSGTWRPGRERQSDRAGRCAPTA